MFCLEGISFLRMEKVDLEPQAMFARGYAFFKGVRFRGVSLYNVFPVCLTSAMLQ